MFFFSLLCCYIHVPSFEEPCYVGRHLTYAILVGGSQIILYAIGLPLLVFLFLRRHRDELDKPVVRFRYGLFFAGFREEKYYWEVVVAMRKESTVILAIFGSQMGVAMLAHVALFVFMIQMLFQLIGNPYDPQRHKLQIMDIMSICKFSRGNPFSYTVLYIYRTPQVEHILYSCFSYLTLYVSCLSLSYFVLHLIYIHRHLLVHNVERIFLLHSSTSKSKNSTGSTDYDCGIGQCFFHVGALVFYVFRNMQREQRQCCSEGDSKSNE